MGGDESVEVNVVYALPDRQTVYCLRVSAGTTVAEAVRRSGVLAAFPEIVPTNVRLGIYGRIVDPGQAVRAGDRIEIYRPLSADPKAVRRARAATKRHSKPL